MKRTEMLSLPDNWEAVLEQLMLKNPIGMRCENIYICSPCRADTPDGVIRNMKAARVYMFYAYQYFSGVPKAPHAYMPILLNDRYEDDRVLALLFGKKMLDNCDKMFVCGNRLSEGMYGEVEAALGLGIPVHVFNRSIFDELGKWALQEAFISPENLRYEDGHLHYALSWCADELAPFWEGENDA